MAGLGMGVAENIRQFRKAAGLTQEGLADKLGVARSTVAQWETGLSMPRMGMAARIANVLGILPSDLVRDSQGDLSGDQGTRGESRERRSQTETLFPLLCSVREPGTLNHEGVAPAPEVADASIWAPPRIASEHAQGYFLQVGDDSMSRVFPKGSLILIDPGCEPRNNSIAMVSVDGGAYEPRRVFRGASTVVLSPESYEEHYKDLVIVDPDEHELSYAGTVVWYCSAGEIS